jgi:DNA polymerase-3 subunit alpha
MNSEELLVQWCRFGWKYRGIGKRPQAEQDWYAERVRYELSLMLEKKLADFMLFTSDAIRWAKDNGIPIGPGRGSTAASVVAWLLRITEIDPYRYQGMLFERFLDVSRADPPDIDIDCSDERRGDVRDYLAAKYGAECVGQIANFTRYRAKNALVDIARVYNIPIAAKEQVASLIIERSGGDSRFDSSLRDTVEMFPDARAIFDRYPDFWKATKLEGNVRGMGVHAAGLIVANSPLTDICAVYEREGVRVLSIDKYDIEYVDALKLDFLGLSTMGMIARCLEMAGLTLEDLYAIPDTDPDTIEIFRRGDVTGVFQFEGRATRLVNRDVVPEHFAHIADINALSRPGPLFSGQTAEYVEVRHGRSRAESLHPMVDDITKDTYGQIIYQEQILRILRDMGGFDWFSVGQIRRIISKKLGEAAFQMSYNQFADGSERFGVSRELSLKIWKRLVTSGTYSFNIAHAISYSMIAFWTAWLKAHYPREFYAASLAKADEEQQFRLMRDALAHDVQIVPPILNASRSNWRPVQSLGIVAGWQQIPGIGESKARRIDELRALGRFGSWADLEKIPGIGPKTVSKMETFSTSHDPFGLQRTARTMERALAWIRTQDRVPLPTHNGAEVAAIQVKERYGAAAQKNYGKGPRVIYAGIIKTRNYQDAVENRRSRTGEEAEDILRTLKRPDLLEYCSLRCYDTTDEEVYIRVNRFLFPRLRAIIQSIAVEHDVVVCVGNRIAGFGTPVMAEKLYVIDPD